MLLHHIRRVPDCVACLLVRSRLLQNVRRQDIPQVMRITGQQDASAKQWKAVRSMKSAAFPPVARLPLQVPFTSPQR